MPDQNGSTTYFYSLNSGKAEQISIKNGRIASDGKVYKTTLIKDKGSEIGHSCKIAISSFDNKLENEITLSSANWIDGAVYLGQDSGNFVIKTHESESDATKVYFKDLVKKVDSNGNLLGIAELPAKTKYVQNDTQMNGQTIVSLNNGENQVSVDGVDFQSPDAYKSDLTPINDTSAKSATAAAAASSSLAWVNRSLIQSTVYSYWLQNWWCSQSNYNTTGGSTRPRYITSYGRYYQCVPYCWGGWDTLANFNSRISSGTTAGNIRKLSISATCGVDCSGYVQRCWGINDYKRDTTGLDNSNISYRISASSLKYGDAWNRSDHIMVYHYNDGYGNYILYEATQLNSYDRVAHTSRTVSGVQSSYHSIRRCNVTEDV